MERGICPQGPLHPFINLFGEKVQRNPRNMTNSVVVLCTFGSREDARRIGSAVVEARLAACVNILPAVESIYRWKGEIEGAEETMTLMKTSEESFPALRDRIKQMHSYETPEIVALPIVSGLEDYLGWIQEQVS